MTASSGRLCDIRSENRRIRLSVFTRAPLATLTLSAGANEPAPDFRNTVIDVVAARELRDALTEFIDIVESEGGDPRARGHGEATGR